MPIRPYPFPFFQQPPDPLDVIPNDPLAKIPDDPLAGITDQPMETETWGDYLLGMGMRTIPGVLGSIGGGVIGSAIPGLGTTLGASAGGAAGSALGEWAAQKYSGKPLNESQIFTQGLIGAIPGFGRAPGAGA